MSARSASTKRPERHGAHDKGYTLDEETWLYPERGREVLRRADLSWNFVFNIYLATKATGR